MTVMIITIVKFCKLKKEHTINFNIWYIILSGIYLVGYGVCMILHDTSLLMTQNLVDKSDPDGVSLDYFNSSLDAINILKATTLMIRGLMIIVCIVVQCSLFRNIDTFSNFSSVRAKSLATVENMTTSRTMSDMSMMM